MIGARIRACGGEALVVEHVLARYWRSRQDVQTSTPHLEFEEAWQRRVAMAYKDEILLGRIARRLDRVRARLLKIPATSSGACSSRCATALWNARRPEGQRD